MYTATRYGLWAISLGVLGCIGPEFRLPYLYGTTLVLWVRSMLRATSCPHLTVTASGALLHSIVHNIWPFLDTTTGGFNIHVSSLPDVLTYLAMFLFVWYTTNRDTLHPAARICTLGYIAGSVVNCRYPDQYGLHYLLFNLTSVFQAVSTAHWVSMCRHYDRWHRPSYSRWLLFSNVYFVLNWAVYNYDHFFLEPGIGAIAFSMRYRYIEGLFIACTWIPLWERSEGCDG